MKVARKQEDVARLAKFDALKNVPFEQSYFMMFGRWPKGAYEWTKIAGKWSKIGTK